MIEKYMRRQSFKFLLYETEIHQGSYIWNEILKEKVLAKSKAKWKIGKGENILFSQDEQTSQGPLIDHPNYGRWAEPCIRRYGLNASDYRTGNGCHDLSMISPYLKSLMISLNAILLNNKRDEVMWGDNLNGQYSVASGYFLLWDRMEKPIWAKAWIPGLTPKINIFFWLLLLHHSCF